MTTMLPAMRLERSPSQTESQTKHEKPTYVHLSDDEVEEDLPFLKRDKESGERRQRSHKESRYSPSGVNRVKGKRKVLNCLFTLIVVVLALLIIVPLVYVFQYFTEPDGNPGSFHEQTSKRSSSDALKKILFFPKYRRDSTQPTEIAQTSKTLNCFITSVKCEVRHPTEMHPELMSRLVRESSAIVFDGSNYDSNANIFTEYHPDKYFVFSYDGHIPADFDYGAPHLKRFNLTMTNNNRSDISTKQYNLISHPIGQSAWGRYDKNPDILRRMKDDVRATISQKTNFILVQGCSEEGKQFYDSLTEFLPDENITLAHDCLGQRIKDSLLVESHKFYIIFEEGYCDDPLSDSFLEALNHNTVPVVFSGPDYKKAAPPDSYIEVGSTRNSLEIELLAKKLQDLNRQPEEHAKYLQWLLQYEVIKEFGPLCKLCELLYRPESMYKEHHPLSQWRSTKDGGNC